MKSREIKIGELADAEPGSFKIGPFGSSLKKDEIFKDGIPVLGIENVLNNTFTPPFRRNIKKDKYKQLYQYTIKTGDILVTTMGTIGYAAVVPDNIGNAIIDSHLFRMRVDQSKVYPHYLCYGINYYDGVKRHLQQMSRGAIMEGLNTTILKECTLPLPSLPEQKRIAAILEKADRLRRLRRYALELTGTYLQSVFLEMFGDPSKNPKNWSTDYLYQLCSKVVDCPHSTPIYTSTPTAYACVRSSDIQDGFLDWSTTKYIDYQEYQKRIRIHVPMPNEVVYCREGARFGNAAIIPNGKKVCLGQRMMLFRAAPDVATPEFIWAFLESESTRKQADGIVGGSASPHLNVGDIKEFIAIIPPLPLQQKFAQIVQKYERLRAQQKEAERQAEHLFQTLLHKAFQGELSSDEDEILMPDVERVHQRMPAVADVIEPIDTGAFQMALPME
jgi:type I restriction enzyme, S subunit